MNIAHSGMIHNMRNTQIHTGNQQAYHQMWMPQMQGYHGQQPGNMTNNQRERGHSQGNQMPIQGYYDQQPGNMTNNQQNPGHSQGNQMPIQGYYGQEPQSFEMANQEQNINAQQIGH
ncbi:uncharacterized protein LOC134723601 [Mytilus trossulus]|uniref:uncharacterized protein LOC134723601 n=1 Tax=Mytilus trossulus TaxID=6551 RepID=UPI00300617A8